MEVLERLTEEVLLLWLERDRDPIFNRLKYFHDFHEYERLVESAKAVGPVVHLVVLFGGDAGFGAGR